MQRLLIIAIIIAAFLAFMVTYTVRFTESAVVTTFGGTGAVKTEPGLRFKIPYVQQVTKYDARTRYLESNQETQQTADNAQVLVVSYMTWRIADPLKFFKAFSASGDSARDHYKGAENVLKTKLRSAMGEVSRFRFGELLATDDKASRLPELEQNILNVISRPGAGEGDASLSDFGIEAVSVGITRMGLPQNTTRAVFDRMNAERKLLADRAITEGQATARALVSSADSDAKKITAFAQALADRIRNQGNIEAAEWIAKVNTNPELAVFLKNLELLEKGFGNSRITLVFPTSMPGLGLLRPDRLNNLQSGQIPAPDLAPLKAAPASDPTPVSGAPTAAPAGGNR